ncbi:MAG: DUF4375 domain-containing protein [Planctomycetes bacterium]|nr:DUF4375 domain-containing protein [Planctomycetota bacterium]
MPEFKFQIPPTPTEITAALIETTADDILENVLLNYVLSIQKCAPESSASLPTALQAHYVAFLVDAEVLNGGFNQLFFNAPEVAAAAPDAFQYFGLEKAASLARRACQLHESVRPRLEAARRDGTIEAFMDTYDESPFQVLDGLYAAAEGEFRDARLYFIRAHADEFLHPRREG